MQTIFDILQRGDVLTVTRIDRLARRVRDLQDIVRAVKVKGASLKATEQPIAGVYKGRRRKLRWLIFRLE